MPTHYPDGTTSAQNRILSQPTRPFQMAHPTLDSPETLSRLPVAISRLSTPSTRLPQPRRHHPAHQHINHSSSEASSIRPQFRSKAVMIVRCKHCESTVCTRGMKAILLADTRVELYSTDSPPPGVALVDGDYVTANCLCRVKDLGCLGCGNVLGYHVTQPCDICLQSCNNGHFFMFHCTDIESCDRVDLKGKSLRWCSIPRADLDKEPDAYERTCR